MRTRSVLFSFAFAALVSACADEPTPGLEGADDVDPAITATASGAKADGLGSTATYYNVTRDMRKCASPMCGGYFVSRVNRTWTLCDDGAWRNACYVHTIDFQGALGLTDDEVNAVTTTLAERHVVVRGSIKRETVAGQKVGRFDPTEAWTAQTGVEPTGTFYRVTDNHRICVAAPCKTYHAAKLNSTLSSDFSALDLSKVGPGDFIADETFARLEKDSVLAVGDIGKIKDSLGFQLAATQVYYRVVHQDLQGYNPSPEELQGRSFADSNAVAPAYPRTYRFEAEGNGVSVDDAVAPCPAGAVCVWSGIVTRHAHWVVNGSSVALTYDADPAAGWTIGYVDSLGAVVDADGNMALVELGTDRLFR
jgi:uncharacterized protein DUF6748